MNYYDSEYDDVTENLSAEDYQDEKIYPVFQLVVFDEH